MRSRVILTALAAAGMTACGGDGGGGPNPTPGSLDVVLTAAPASTGAILFAVSGGPIDGVTSSFTKYESTTAGNSRKVLLTGNLSLGVVARIQVPDIADADNYVVLVIEGAARGSAPIPYQKLPTNVFTFDVQ